MLETVLIFSLQANEDDEKCILDSALHLRYMRSVAKGGEVVKLTSNSFLLVNTYNIPSL